MCGTKTSRMNIWFSFFWTICSYIQVLGICVLSLFVGVYIFRGLYRRRMTCPNFIKFNLCFSDSFVSFMNWRFKIYEFKKRLISKQKENATKRKQNSKAKNGQTQHWKVNKKKDQFNFPCWRDNVCKNSGGCWKNVNHTELHAIHAFVYQLCYSTT